MILFAAPLVCASEHSMEDAATAARAFYDTYLTFYSFDTPDADMQRHFAGLLSEELSALLRNLDLAEQRYYEQTKGEVPPLIEGDLFTSSFEGATAFEVVLCEENEAGGASCQVELTNTVGAEPPFSWHDRVMLIEQDGRWVVDDIEFLGDWDFMHKGTLKGLITEILKDH